MEDLPEQALMIIMGMVADPQSLACVACTCRRLRSLGRSMPDGGSSTALQSYGNRMQCIGKVASGVWRDELFLAAVAPADGQRLQRITFSALSITPSSARAAAALMVSSGLCQALYGPLSHDDQPTMQLLHGSLKPQSPLQPRQGGTLGLGPGFLDLPVGQQQAPFAASSLPSPTWLVALLTHPAPICSVVLQPQLPLLVTCASPQWPPVTFYQHPFPLPPDMLLGPGAGVALVLPCPPSPEFYWGSGKAATLTSVLSGEPSAVSSKRCESVLRFLSQSPSLRSATYLDISYLAATQQQLYCMLTKCGKTVKYLAACWTSLSLPILDLVGQQGLLLDSLTHLDLSQALSTGAGTGQTFGVALRQAMILLPKLQELRIADNDLSGWLGCDGELGLVDAALKRHLAQLLNLDLAGCSGLSASQVFGLLQCCSGLRQLDVSRCKSVALNGGTERLESLLSLEVDTGSTTSNQALPSLRRLAVGWGVTALSLRRALICSCHSLVTVEVGIGASLTDRGLAALAAAHPLLETVKLTMAAVSDDGVSALLWSCARLHRLALIECVGPFSAAMLQAAPGLCSLCTPSGDARAATAEPSAQIRAACRGRCVIRTGRRPLTELQLRGGNITLSDNDLAALIGRPHSPGVGLHTLALCGLPIVSDVLLHFLGCHHAASLQHLQLERCGSAPQSPSATMAYPASSGQANSHVAGLGLSQAGMLELLSKLQQLRSLRLRHCCIVGPSFVEGARQLCPLLNHLTLDHCDLSAGGFEHQQRTYGALQEVQMRRCSQAGLSVAVHDGGPDLPLFCSMVDQPAARVYSLSRSGAAIKVTLM